VLQNYKILSLFVMTHFLSIKSGDLTYIKRLNTYWIKINCHYK